MNRLASFTRSLVYVAVALVATCATEANAEPLSMAEFLALEPKWEAMAEERVPIQLEGRLASAAPRLVKLQKCPLAFRPAGEVLPDIRGNAAVDVSGYLGRRGKEIVVYVTEIRERTDDRQVFSVRESALDRSDAADWYELADWALKRGTFYDDAFLIGKAAAARRRGLAVERDAASGDSEAIAELAKKAERFGLADQQRQLSHHALRIEFDQLKEKGDARFEPLIARIESRLPGASKPLDEWPVDLAAGYASEPLAVYNRADDERRTILDRIFFAEVQLAAIERMADRNGANGLAIADKIDSVLPERAPLAEHYREREIEYRLKRITQATRSEALDLARRLEERNRAAEAKQALARWLAAREATEREDGPSGLIAVAEDYASVLGDRASAARLLLEALKANPDSETIPDRLRQLGYVRVQGEWITKEEAAKRPVDPVVKAMREGRIAVGMSPEQVRKTLGIPDRVARAASTSQIHETWIYGQRGRGGIAVHFLRYSARAAEDGRVVGVATLGR